MPVETTVLIPSKKLGLAQKAKTSTELVFDLHRCTDSQQNLQSLIYLESADQIVSSLLSLFHRERESSLRAKVAGVLGKLATTPGFSPSLLLDAIIPAAKCVESHSILSQVIIMEWHK